MKKFRGQVELKGALARNRMSSTSFKPGLLTSKYKGNKSKLRPPQFGLKRSYVREKNWSVTQIKGYNLKICSLTSGSGIMQIRQNPYELQSLKKKWEGCNVRNLV